MTGPASPARRQQWRARPDEGKAMGRSGTGRHGGESSTAPEGAGARGRGGGRRSPQPRRVLWRSRLPKPGGAVRGRGGIDGTGLASPPAAVARPSPTGGRRRDVLGWAGRGGSRGGLLTRRLRGGAPVRGHAPIWGRDGASTGRRENGAGRRPKAGHTSAPAATTLYRAAHTCACGILGTSRFWQGREVATTPAFALYGVRACGNLW